MFRIPFLFAGEGIFFTNESPFSNGFSFCIIGAQSRQSKIILQGRTECGRVMADDIPIHR